MGSNRSFLVFRTSQKTDMQDKKTDSIRISRVSGREASRWSTMSSIPVDVLREILEHVHYADLPALCQQSLLLLLAGCPLSRDSRRCRCYYSKTLSQSTGLAKRFVVITQNYQRPYETCRHFAAWTSVSWMMPLFWMGALSS
jgi:hypothetical protein